MAVAAKNSQVLVKIGETPVAFKELRDWSLSCERGTIDASVLSTEWKRFLSGQISATGSFTLFFDPDDATAEETIETAMFTGVEVELYFRPQGTGAGRKQYKLNAFVTTWSPAGATEDAVGVTVNFAGTGAIDNTPQA
jgi:hypothetical protein